jgi:hypothetical protein
MVMSCYRRIDSRERHRSQQENSQLLLRSQLEATHPPTNLNVAAV